MGDQGSFAFLISEPHLPIFTFSRLPGTAAPDFGNWTLSVGYPSFRLSSLTSQQDTASSALSSRSLQ
jgi:hypothetical protein